MSKSALSVVERRLRKELAPQIAAAFAAQRGQFTIADVAKHIERELKKEDLNEYAPEIAYRIAQQEDHQRASQTLPESLALFTRDAASDFIVPLGDGLRVKYRDATWANLHSKSRQQARQIASVAAAHSRWAEFMEELAPAMEASPTKTVSEAMIELGKWSSNSVVLQATSPQIHGPVV